MARKSKTQQNPTVEVMKNITAEDLELDEVDRRLLKMFVEYPTMAKEQMASALGINRTTIYARMDKPAFKRALADMTKDFMELLKDAQTLAVRQLRKLLQDSDKQIVLQALKLAMAPYVNQGTLKIQNETIIHSVQVGDDGQIIRDVKSLPTTKDAVEHAPDIKTTEAP